MFLISCEKHGRPKHYQQVLSHLGAVFTCSFGPILLILTIYKHSQFVLYVYIDIYIWVKNLKSYLVHKLWPVFVATVNWVATWFEQHAILSRKVWDHKIVVAIVSKFVCYNIIKTDILYNKG